MPTRLNAIVERARALNSQNVRTLELVSILDREGIIRYVSSRHFDVLGFEPPDLEGRSGFEFIHPDDKDDVMQRFSNLCATSNDTDATFRVKCNDDRNCWVDIEAHAAALFVDDACVGFMVVSCEVCDIDALLKYIRAGR